MAWALLWLLRSGGGTAPCCPGAARLRHAAQESPQDRMTGSSDLQHLASAGLSRRLPHCLPTDHLRMCICPRHHCRGPDELCAGCLRGQPAPPTTSLYDMSLHDLDVCCLGTDFVFVWCFALFAGHFPFFLGLCARREPAWQPGWLVVRVWM
jgi:hypothetical protein